MHGACIGLLSAEFSTVSTGLGWPTFWKPLCLLSTPEGLATTKLHRLLKFQPKISTFSKTSSGGILHSPQHAVAEAS